MNVNKAGETIDLQSQHSTLSTVLQGFRQHFIGLTLSPQSLAAAMFPSFTVLGMAGRVWNPVGEIVALHCGGALALTNSFGECSRGRDSSCVWDCE
jgi:hypothetical protein